MAAKRWRDPHVKKAVQYAQQVRAKKIPAAKYVRLACERFLRDLERTDLVFDERRARRPCRFIEHLPHVKGRWAARSERIELQPWQCFVLVNIFGFFTLDGRRRFRVAYVCVPRKNGKSLIAAGVGLYCLVADGEYGAEVYSGATTEKQAWEVFRPAHQIANKCAELKEHYGIEVMAKSLSVPGDGAKFEPIIGNPGDGASPSCALVDEYHEHNTSALYDTMITGMGARENPLALVITTAGDSIAGPCHEMQQDCEKTLDGVFDDDNTFAAIYGIDATDDWTSDAAILKANPNAGVSVSLEFLRERRDSAMRKTSEQGTYQTKHLNRWVQAGQAFINLLHWQRAADKRLKLADFVGDSCVFGVDLSSRVAFTAHVRLFWRFLEEKGQRRRHWYAFARLALPNARLHDGSNTRFSQWARAGAIDVHDEDEIDFARLRADVKADADVYTPVEIAFDPWRAMGLEQELAADGLTMVRIPQTFGQYTAPMDELEAALISGRFHHDGNPALTWMASNLVARQDGNRNKKPAAPKQGQFIDGMVALLMAINRGLAHDGEGQFIDTSYLENA